MLRRLAGNTRQLPDNYSVSKGANFRVEENIFACGKFSDVRKGIMVGKAVAVKTIRMAQDKNLTKIRKVGTLIDIQSRFS